MVARVARSNAAETHRYSQILQVVVERGQVDAEWQEVRVERRALSFATLEDLVERLEEVNRAEGDLRLVATEMLAKQVFARLQ
jgi:hypothetical protein